MGKLGRWLRRTILNPVKNLLAKTPIGQVMEKLVPGSLDPAVNLFAKSAPPPLVAPTVQPPPQTTSIPTAHLRALVAEAREAGRLRAELAQYRAAPPQPGRGVNGFSLW